ncbi:SET domain-containing protein [Pholiota conissans]|uniref:SET domain-containing protein n=1 Tax=Pholiota conissans TaxID=109636 RepID=A0A9P6CV17_9AGAR|nr:SET domain-containing protein [Pholiota conissans]
MSEAAKSRLFNMPGFPKPVPKPRGRVQPYEVKMTPNMGMGVFATRDIKMGELVFAERPLFGGPKNINMLSLEVPGSGFLAQKLVLDEYEKLLELCVERMSEANRTGYTGLTNSHKEDGSGPLTGISRTNGYGVAEVFDGVGPKPISDDFRYAFVGNTASRINHSCLHNVVRTFDIAAFAFVFTAVLDIKAGEQIFYPYCNIEASVAVRRRQLAPYGIVCECRVCTNATPESDKFREEYRSSTVELFAQAQQVMTGKSWPTNDEFRELLIFQKAAIEEGLHAVSAYQGILGALTFAHMGRGHVAKVQELQVKMQKFAGIF